MHVLLKGCSWSVRPRTSSYPVETLPESRERAPSQTRRWLLSKIQPCSPRRLRTLLVHRNPREPSCGTIGGIPGGIGFHLELNQARGGVTFDRIGITPVIVRVPPDFSRGLNAKEAKPASRGDPGRTGSSQANLRTT